MDGASRGGGSVHVSERTTEERSPRAVQRHLGMVCHAGRALNVAALRCRPLRNSTVARATSNDALDDRAWSAFAGSRAQAWRALDRRADQAAGRGWGSTTTSAGWRALARRPSVGLGPSRAFHEPHSRARPVIPPVSACSGRGCGCGSTGSGRRSSAAVGGTRITRSRLRARSSGTRTARPGGPGRRTSRASRPGRSSAPARIDLGDTVLVAVPTTTHGAGDLARARPPRPPATRPRLLPRHGPDRAAQARADRLGLALLGRQARDGPRQDRPLRARPRPDRDLGCRRAGGSRRRRA